MRLSASLLFAGSLGACYAPPPPRPRMAVVYAVRQPPAERVEIVPASPGPQYVWVKGFWGWRRNDYVWTAGHWVVPERGYREWVPGKWDRDRNGWLFIEGHWR
jgi:hypothetical protein